MDNKIQSLLDKGFSDLAPDCFDEIIEGVSDPSYTPNGCTEELSRMLSSDNVRVKRRKAAASLAAAAVLVLCLFSLRWYDALKITDEIYIDVNPSVALEINRNGEFVRAEGKNTDGNAVASACAEQLKGLKDPVEAAAVLIDEIRKENYFQRGKGSVLVTWRSDSFNQNTLLDEVLNAVYTYADANGLDLAVYTQSIRNSEDLSKEAEDAGMPESRYAFYKSLADQHNISLEELKDKNMDEATEYIDKLEAVESADAGEKSSQGSETSAEEASEDNSEDVSERVSGSKSKKKNSENSDVTDETQESEGSAPASVTVSSIKCTKKGNIQISFADKVYYGNSVSAVLKDESNRSVEVSIKTTAPQKLILSTDGLNQGSSYKLTIHGVKAQKKGKSDTLSLTFEY